MYLLHTDKCIGIVYRNWPRRNFLFGQLHPHQYIGETFHRTAALKLGSSHIATMPHTLQDFISISHLLAPYFSPMEYSQRRYPISLPSLLYPDPTSSPSQYISICLPGEVDMEVEELRHVVDEYPQLVFGHTVNVFNCLDASPGKKGSHLVSWKEVAPTTRMRRFSTESPTLDWAGFTWPSA